MARIKKKGEAGAAKAYVTRTAAIKKLQCSLADFRRLCILKGIFPREPRNKKKANKGSTAPTSFYYAKDIAYLAHEPVLRKLREHKAFAKKFARALGRGEWSSAKSLEDHKPVYRIDHIIKERYPSFTDAVRDLDDALCMIFLFASLPSSQRLPPSLIDNCAKLTAEWQLYIMKTSSLRKAFLSIKGVYYQAEVMGEAVTWLVPYTFAQNVPPDVDLRVMLTFLELYQTVLGFVLFKLYTDAGFIYPPPVDIQRDEAAGGIGAFTLRDASSEDSQRLPIKTVSVSSSGKKVTVKDVREAIKDVQQSVGDVVEGGPPVLDGNSIQVEEDFVVQPSSSESNIASSELVTLQVIEATPSKVNSKLFANCVFFLSRETPRTLFEFVVRSFNGRIGWHASQGAGSMVQEDDDSITHVIIDRPVVSDLANETEEQRLRRIRRKYVQPQWVIDCINAGRLLLEDDYAQGKMLPPHLSPFDSQDGVHQMKPAIDDDDNLNGEVAHEDEEGSKSDGASDITEDEDSDTKNIMDGLSKTIQEALVEPGMLRAAELKAEAAGMDASQFVDAVSKAQRRSAKQEGSTTRGKEMTEDKSEKEMSKMMMSNKQRKLYEKLKYTEKKKTEERTKLERKRKQIAKERRGAIRGQT